MDKIQAVQKTFMPRRSVVVLLLAKEAIQQSQTPVEQLVLDQKSQPVS